MEIQVALNTVQDVDILCKAARQMDCDVTIQRVGYHAVLDASSIMAIMSLGLGHIYNINVNTKDGVIMKDFVYKMKSIYFTW